MPSPRRTLALLLAIASAGATSCRERTVRPERPNLPRDLRLMTEHLDRLALRLEPADPGSEARSGPVPQVLRAQVAGPRERAPAEDEPLDEGRTPANNQSPAPVTPASSRIESDFLPLVSEPRFRDWNPDARVAREQGVSIRYDSALNRVVCEGCRARADGSIDLSDFGSGSSGGSGSGDGDSGSAGSGPTASDRAGPAGGGSTKDGPIDR